MNFLLSLLTQILHIGLMIAAAPAVAGLLDWLDGRLTGRSGPPLLLPFRDLVRLSRKTPVTLESLSIVSRLAPMVGLAATLTAAALVPSFILGSALSPLADVLVVASLLTTARVAMVLVALDSGAAAPGLAAQNSSALATLAEPALMLAMVAVALMAGSFNLDLIIGQQHEGVLLPASASAVAVAALLALVAADRGGTDVALDTMLSGIDLAMAHMMFWLRRLVWIDLIGGLFLPVGMAAADTGPLSWLVGLSCWTIKLGAFVVCLSGVRTLLGRIPRHSLPDLVGIAALLALLAIIIVLASAGTA